MTCDQIENNPEAQTMSGAISPLACAEDNAGEVVSGVLGSGLILLPFSVEDMMKSFFQVDSSNGGCFGHADVTRQIPLDPNLIEAVLAKVDSAVSPSSLSLSKIIEEGGAAGTGEIHVDAGLPDGFTGSSLAAADLARLSTLLEAPAAFIF